MIPLPGPLSLARQLRDHPALAARLRGVERAAASAAPVLILGEPGSGRSALARALHAASPRAAGPLIEVDPGAVPSALFESEFFGYLPGAFTGAVAASEGRVARASAGTLLLDHVEELPLSSQPKLLRLLAERRYAPLGGEETEVDARFVAIGPDDLPRRVAQGAFRADLYYRMEVVAFVVPPLRERREDLPALLDDMLLDLGERFDRPRLALAPAARAWMLEHPWPGNLRQMKNVLERSLILAGGDLVVGVPPSAAAPLDPPAPPADPSAGPLAGPPCSLADLEQEHIRAVLAHTRGHQGRAAELLGISRKSLWEKRRRYGVP